MTIIKTSKTVSQAESIAALQAAADGGDGRKFLEMLFGSTLLEGLGKQFKKKYSLLNPDDVDGVIGSSIDAVYVKVCEKARIDNIDSYLWKVIDRNVAEFKRISLLTAGSTTVEKIGAVSPSLDSLESEETLKRRSEALDLAESLLPRVELSTPREVLAYYFGAIRAGADSLSSQEIGEALNITDDNARQSLRRGLTRLARIVREEKLMEEDYVFPFDDLSTVLEDPERDEDNYDGYNDEH